IASVRPRAEQPVRVPHVRAVPGLPARARTHELHRHRGLLAERDRGHGEVRAARLEGDLGVALDALVQVHAADAVAEKAAVVVAVAAADLAPAGTAGDAALEDELWAAAALVVQADGEVGARGGSAERDLRRLGAAEPAPGEAVAVIGGRVVLEQERAAAVRVRGPDAGRRGHGLADADAGRAGVDRRAQPAIVARRAVGGERAAARA